MFGFWVSGKKRWIRKFTSWSCKVGGRILFRFWRVREVWNWSGRKWVKSAEIPEVLEQKSKWILRFCMFSCWILNYHVKGDVHFSLLFFKNRVISSDFVVLRFFKFYLDIEKSVVNLCLEGSISNKLAFLIKKPKKNYSKFSFQ